MTKENPELSLAEEVVVDRIMPRIIDVPVQEDDMSALGRGLARAAANRTGPYPEPLRSPTRGGQRGSPDKGPRPSAA